MHEYAHTHIHKIGRDLDVKLPGRCNSVWHLTTVEPLSAVTSE